MTPFSRVELATWFSVAGRGFLSPEEAKLPPGDSTEPASESLRSVYDRLEDAIASDPPSISAEYARLFLNPLGAPCPPWQSAYSEEPQLFGSTHESALWWYRAEGVEPALGGEPADHVGLLLLFAAHLLLHDAPEEWTARFFSAHGAWIEDFCDRVYCQSRHAYFRVLAEVTSNCISQWRLVLARTIQ